MKYENIINGNTASSVMEWLWTEMKLKKIPIIVQMNEDHTIKTLEIDKKLSSADKTKLESQYPELEGKEIG